MLNLLTYMQLLKDTKAKLREAAEECETKLLTTRSNGTNVLQDLEYEYEE
jgi:hypothetical protein